jgi:hypothetical protein
VRLVQGEEAVLTLFMRFIQFLRGIWQPVECPVHRRLWWRKPLYLSLIRPFPEGTAQARSIQGTSCLNN